MSGDFVSVMGITEDCDKGVGDELAHESGRLGLCQRAPPVTSFSADRPELFAQGQALPLIRRSYADAVNLFGRLQQSHVR